MQTLQSNAIPMRRARAFTLVEMLVVIAIISILMTAGVIGLNSMGGKGVTSGVATAESVFDEARTTAIGRNVRACVLVAKDLTNNRADDLRRMMVAYEEVDAATGLAKDPTNTSPNWELSSRAVLLPDQTYFSQKFSRKSQQISGAVDEIASSKLKMPGGGAIKQSFAGTYYIYRFNREGMMCDDKWNGVSASFVIGSGTRKITGAGSVDQPRVTASGKKDFGGFVIWKNGGSSVFRSPDQIGQEVKSLNPGDKF